MRSKQNGLTSNSRKRKLAPLLESTFLDALVAPSSAPATATVSSDNDDMLQLTNGAVQALHDCQEEFVAHLTRHLKDVTTTTTNGNGKKDKDDDNDNQEETKRRVHVNPRHVEEAMRAMGLHAIFEDAQRLSCSQNNEQQQQEEEYYADDQGHADTKKAAQTTKSKPANNPPSKKRPKKKSKIITAEMEAEQERLLQASREKILDTQTK